MTARVRIIEVDGHRLEVAWWGRREGARAPLVLLHEGLGCVAMWKSFPAALHSRTGRDVFAYTRLGYGGSSPAQLPRPVTYMHFEAEQLLGPLLEAAGIHHPVLVGHSDGASIALLFAGSQRPGSNVAGLALMAPHVFTEPESVSGVRAAGVAYRKGKLRERLARYHGNQVDAAFSGWHDAWLKPEFAHWNIEPFLPRVDVPVLMIQGEEDQYGTMRQLDAIESQVCGPTDRAELSGCGHAPHTEQPDAVLELISGWLDRRIGG